MASKNNSAKRPKVPCGVCQAPVIDGKDEALLCEGECGLWLHRGCASVPPSRYKTLSSSDEPFVCLCCSNYQLRKELAQVKSELSVATALTDAVEMLKMEVKQLKETLAAATSELSSLRSNRPPAKSTYASKAAARRPAQQARHRNLTNKDANRSNQTPSSSDATATRSQGDIPAPANRRERVPVEGVRRVWGTLKATSTTAVASTLQKLTTVGNQISVRKKTRSDTNRWWFLLKGTESLLCKLEGEWDKVSLQTNWKLEPCTKPSSESVLQTSSTSTADNPARNPPSIHAQSINSAAATNSPSPPTVERNDEADENATRQSTTETLPTVESNQQGAETATGHSDNDRAAQE